MDNRKGVAELKNNDQNISSVKKVSLILQLRMGSTRRPGKSMADICGKPLAERVMMRLEKIFSGTKIAALPDHPRDDVLADFAESRGWKVFRGSESDVLSRFAGAAKKFPSEKFIRICGDNPLVDPEAVNGVIKTLENYKSCMTKNYPLGTGAEGALCEALFEADNEADEAYDREHVMPYIYKNPERFALKYFYARPLTSQPRLTVDTENDLNLFREIFSEFGDYPLLEDVIRFIENKK